jgi:urea transport system ATP-binding protein
MPGSIIFDDHHDLTRMREDEIYGSALDANFRRRRFNTDHTVFENLLLSLAGSRGVWASLVSRVKAEERERHPRDPENGAAYREDAMRKAGSLAHGQKQWLEIGMLLASAGEAAADR